ncbi:MAG: MltA domain-containing protein [Planctomycetes bacterium]|nr:MltA domain-containing protein [Planctomycetota bacterium]
MIRASVLSRWVVILSVLTLAMAGCQNSKVVPSEGPDYSKMLPPGAMALRKITDPSQRPSLAPAFSGKDAALLTAIDRSIAWYAKPSSKTFFPINDIAHDQAQASATAMRQILAESGSAEEFSRRVYEEFDAYISVGYDDKGTVLYTGYYSPTFTASTVRTAEYAYPLYRRPADLVSDPVTGQTMGRRTAGGMQTYPTRAQIESSNMLTGTELVWLPSRLDAYIIHVNGSARLTMTDGSTRYIGFAGTNGYDYTSLGKMLSEDGKMNRNKVSLPAIREYFRLHPTELEGYIHRNDRFTFFQNYTPDTWPAGSLGVKVTDFRTLATDKTIFPRGAVILAQTSVPTGVGDSKHTFDQFMLDQDTGGAIRAAGRGDIYMGVGAPAEALAGRQFAEGRLYYFFLKPERVQAWLKGSHPGGPM